MEPRDSLTSPSPLPHRSDSLAMLSGVLFRFLGSLASKFEKRGLAACASPAAASLDASPRWMPLRRQAIVVGALLLLCFASKAATPRVALQSSVPCLLNPQPAALSGLSCGGLAPGGPSVGSPGKAALECTSTVKCCRWDFAPTCNCDACPGEACTWTVRVTTSCPFDSNYADGNTWFGPGAGPMGAPFAARAACNNRVFVFLSCGGNSYTQILRCECVG
jgi:hypothetical protein